MKRLSTLENSPFDTRTQKQVREDIRQAGVEGEAEKPKPPGTPPEQKEPGSEAPTIEVDAAAGMEPRKKTPEEMAQDPEAVLDPEEQIDPIIQATPIGTAT